MCGLFGGFGDSRQLLASIDLLATLSRRRGSDSSGLITCDSRGYRVLRADFHIGKLMKKVGLSGVTFVAGHSRLITNGHNDNQPVIREGIGVLHNGVIVNAREIWDEIGEHPQMEIDTEIIAGIARTVLNQSGNPEQIPASVVEKCRGVVNCVMVIPELGRLLLFSNNGSLYIGQKNGSTFFASEENTLRSIACSGIEQIVEPRIFEIPVELGFKAPIDYHRIRPDLVPALPKSSGEANLLDLAERDLLRCAQCVLPETMPFIKFDSHGVCNYCKNYTPRNSPRPLDELLHILDRYKRDDRPDCIIPFSGGRDSSFGLHFAVNELGLKPIAYTYDWGMVTDLGRRNISRMCSALGVENIVIAADISKKRMNIRKNLTAWLANPHLGMVSILTAGDKHFFRHIESVKVETSTNLNLWAINPLEVTHFKSGFLGIPPDFAEQRVYASGLSKQLEYQQLRFRAMAKSPRYFNRSLWDTLSGEYYRSGLKKSDYFHLFDYMRWDEKQINTTLKNYGWETAVDTSTTWRIGDGTAAFYNYVYGRVAGFTEHDTFRSNQIREGDITRGEAMRLITGENQPRYQNIRWYLDAVGLDFEDVIRTVNAIPLLGE